jgi:predicted metal-dependent hydrolase
MWLIHYPFPYCAKKNRTRRSRYGCGAVRLVRGRLQLRQDCVDDAADLLVHWYRKAGESWLRKRVTPWSQRMSMEVTSLRVLPLGYRWGSCSPGAKVNIHWATMQLPPDLIDYVLVHELTHLRHRDHGTDFWRAVDRAIPGWESRRARLKRAGPDLWLPV